MKTDRIFSLSRLSPLRVMRAITLIATAAYLACLILYKDTLAFDAVRTEATEIYITCLIEAVFAGFLLDAARTDLEARKEQ